MLTRIACLAVLAIAIPAGAFAQRVGFEPESNKLMDQALEHGRHQDQDRLRDMDLRREMDRAQRAAEAPAQARAIRAAAKAENRPLTRRELAWIQVLENPRINPGEHPTADRYYIPPDNPPRYQLLPFR